MPNVNQGYASNLHSQPSQSYNQMQNIYPTNPNNMGRGSSAVMSPNQYNSQMDNMSNQYPVPSPGGNQNIQSPYGNQNVYNQMPNGNLNHSANNTMTLRGQAKLAEMSEEVTRRQQRGHMNIQGDNSVLSPVQQNR